MIGLADIPVTSVCSGLNGGIFTSAGRDCWDQNDSGRWILPRIGPSQFEDAEASYWIGSVINPTLLIGGGSGTAAKGVSTATTTVFRAVGPEELASIRAVGGYTPGPGNIGKYFYPTQAQAESLAARYTELGIGGPYTITSGKVPTALLDDVDAIYPAGEGPAWFIHNEQLPSICEVICLGGTL